jgi:hypothetical protein
MRTKLVNVSGCGIHSRVGEGGVPGTRREAENIQKSGRRKSPVRSNGSRCRIGKEAAEAIQRVSRRSVFIQF